ncbi:MAG: M24 family metallopeptidase [Desulfobacterales bacterium]|nr:M24 family metallopeptidase [Desulfobacterales bacterium]
MRYTPIDPELFIQNRKRLALALEPNAIAVFNSNDVMPTSADGVFPFNQNSDIFYLSGIDQEETILVLRPGAIPEKHREILFIRKTDKKIATWEGHKYTKEEAREASGIRTVYWTSEFERIFRPLVFESERIYLNTNEHTRADVSVETRDARFLKKCTRDYPLHAYRRLAPIMQRLRAIKSAGEIELIREACRITEKAFRRMLGFIKPGAWEFEIEAEMIHEFLMNRSSRHAFSPIIASGENSCVLHYLQNDQRCADGDVLLMDFGAEYANYAADVTRTVPVNGRFTPRQRDVYNVVLRVMKGAKEMLRPGSNLEEYNKAVGKIMESELIGLGLLDKESVKNQKKDDPLYKKYYMHGASHYMGLDVHDIGDIRRPFEPGMVFSCEPGVYIREESLGIRLENDILITDGDPVDLTETIPIDPEEIEDLMNRP